MVQVNGTDKTPDTTTDPNGFAEWKSRDLKARAQIILALKDELLKSVLGATTARECWERVSDYCRRLGVARLQMVFLVRKLFQTTLSDSKQLESQIRELLWAARMLSNAGLGFKDGLIAMAIFNSLPSSLSYLKTILLDIENSKLSSQDVLLNVISDEQLHISNSGIDVITDFANAARMRGGRGRARARMSNYERTPEIGRASCRERV